MLPRSVIAGAIMGIAVISGGMMIQSGAWREAGAATASARLLDQVVSRLTNDYLDSLPLGELYRRAAGGFVRELQDPYSTLLTPEAHARLREGASGRYAGIGVELDIRDGFVTVIAPIANTPADSAGVQPGDRIVAIEGRPVVGLDIDEVQAALRGPSGTRVRLTLDRESSDEDMTVTLTRRTIVYSSIQRRLILSDGVGYAELATFTQDAARDVRRAVDSLRAAGARSLILDLRANPGGLFEQGIAVADLLLDSGQAIVSTRGRTPDVDQEYAADSPSAWPTMPVVVLVDSGTASASEIVAGALQDHGRAVLVGSPTYGKGSAQSVFPVNGGRALKLTTARWFTPRGRSIQRDSARGGIDPDVIVRVASDRRAAADTVRPPPPPVDRTPVNDPVVLKAIELLRGAGSPEELRSRLPRPR